MASFSVFLSVVVFSFFFFKHPVFVFYRRRKAVFALFFFSVTLPSFQIFLVYVVRRHPGESGLQMAEDV